MYTCQCEGCPMGQRSDVLLKEVAAFQRCHCFSIAIIAWQPLTNESNAHTLQRSIH